MPPSSLPWKQVRDAKGHWYDAKVVDERGQGEERELKFHWHGWHARFDEWVLASSDRIVDEEEELPQSHCEWGSKRGADAGAAAGPAG